MRALRTLGVLATTSVIAACGSTTQADPTRESPQDAATSSVDESATQNETPDNTSDLPSVANPIDPSSWEENPCNVLTRKQQDKLSIDTESDHRSESVCEWGDRVDDGIRVRGNFAPNTESSIEGLYRNNELGSYAYFNPAKINGYPAFFSDLSDGRDAGLCGVYIALQDDYIYSLGVALDNDHPSYDEPCSVLKDVAEMAVDTMSGGGS